MNLDSIFAALDLQPDCRQGGDRAVFTPIDGSEIAHVTSDDAASAARKIVAAEAAFVAWRAVPAPRRGELIRLLGEELRAHKEALGRLVTLESGKILQEGMGEVQEMIDICDFAGGLSRQLYGLTNASELPGHRMMETWHPLGVCAVISAFNFPAAVWSWNFALAIVCGDPVVWKPSEKTPLTALACKRLFERAAGRFDGKLPDNLLQILIGEKEVGAALVDDKRVALVSATGSCAMGREVAPRVAARFGRTLMELGGNNAMIVAPSADLALAERAITFSAVGTAGQRCTSLRRLIAHDDVADELVKRLKAVYADVPIGSPLDDGVLLGPLMDSQAFDAMQVALTCARDEGGTVTGGKRVLLEKYPHGFYVTPAIVEMPRQTAIVAEETFAPILYVMRYGALGEAIAIHNGVPQGLSSCIFTNEMREAEHFLSSEGSDCGISNVNIGPSGAEIGGAFGGEKETGGGRESGTEAWKSYMRRATNTINYSPDLPLAQGITFGGE